MPVRGPGVGGLGRYSDPAILILTSLTSGPKHGYGLMKDIEAFAETAIAPGTLYGALDRLADQGLIECLPAEQRRHPYRITDAGAKELRAYYASLSLVTSALGARLGVLGA
jgi:DNA-binding PadR family transcriptional regulator